MIIQLDIELNEYGRIPFNYIQEVYTRKVLIEKKRHIQSQQHKTKIRHPYIKTN